jgi:hypothetical protein
MEMETILYTILKVARKGVVEGGPGVPRGRLMIIGWEEIRGDL